MVKSSVVCVSSRMGRSMGRQAIVEMKEYGDPALRGLAR